MSGSKYERKKDGYAYRDKGNLMHIAHSREIAEKDSANGECAYVEFPNLGGYPMIGNKGEVFDYGGNEVYLGGRKGFGERVWIGDERVQEYVRKVRGRVDG